MTVKPLTTPRHSAARQRLIIAVLAFAGMGTSFMQTVLVPIQGELPALLHASQPTTSWAITATLLTAAVFTPISGRLGDMYGKKRIALILLGVLFGASVVAIFAQHVALLIIARTLQGVGMGVIPLGIALLRDEVDPRRLGSSIALVSATLGVGGAIGLPVSAIITEHLDWHILFVLAALIALVAFILVALVVPPGRPGSGGRVDLLGAIGLAVGLLSLLLAISQGSVWGWTSPLTLACVIGGVCVLLVWGVFELRAKDPLVDLRVAARRPVLLTNIGSIALGFALFSASIAFPRLLTLPPSEGGMGLDLLAASIVLMPSGLAMLAMSPVAGIVERRVGPKPLFIVGAVIIAVSYLLAVVLHLNAWTILAINGVIGIGIGLGYAAMPTLIMQSVPVRESGAANGLNALMRSLGTSIAAAAIAAVIAQGESSTAPAAQGFTIAFLLGAGAAALCALIALFIPRARYPRDAVVDDRGSTGLGQQHARPRPSTAVPQEVIR
ncbi:MFS transporter [Microbacterium mangrovi]|uniref:MFS transporter n=1 Tax=Microbacterium mangrovi TaxID=1348253 RepID=UPI000AA5C740|nr:MFS transporter [Microbacterium mangrovi]